MRGEGGALVCTRLDDHKKPIAGSEFSLNAELVLLAIGQGKLVDLLKGLDGADVKDGKVITDPSKGVFAGGDCANGGKEVVNAAAEGKLAAQAIHKYLGGAHA